MIYTYSYNSPLGRIIVASHEDALIGLWFEGQKFFECGEKECCT